MRSPHVIAATVVMAATAALASGGQAMASSILASPVLPAPGTWIPTAGGTVRVLDKQKAASQVMVLKVGETARFETLSVTLEACDAHAPSVPADAAGRVTVADSRDGEPGYQGWMFANEPWVAMLQSPVYGVRVVGCDRPTPEAVAAATPAPLPPPTTPVAPVSAFPSDASPSEASPPPSDLQAPPGQPLEPPDAGAPAPASGGTDSN